MLRHLIHVNDSKIIFLVMDGLGGIRSETFPKTALEAAATPNLDRLAREGLCGRHMPVGMGITPGSGPAHFALFGYDPLAPENDAGRGVVEVTGVGYELLDDDIAIRGNFATVDAGGVLVDRRAGRIPHEEGVRICRKMQEAISAIDDVETIVMPVREYRFGLVLRGPGLSPEVEETDPQATGQAPLPPAAYDPKAEKTAAILASFVEKARAVLADEKKANAILLRGISRKPVIASFQERYRLDPVAVAAYPLYRGVARLCGMALAETGFTVEEEFETVRSLWKKDHDFFFVHVKKTDSYGEDGNHEKKVGVIEEVDRLLPMLLDLEPDVIIVTGDHSTPCALKSHSWHPVPFLIRSAVCGPDDVAAFHENACDHGGLGIFPATSIMTVALANAGKLMKYGA
ncbi:MAG: 2,3-bisphosphoglycerate-independent phosphoglycerate mutase [Candidatus Krumholzibacteriota bacterium]|nr:2,3-bisphosphoglycerate-independent phosphoglycerate mutase [Candidatus Krumholzibacteriota bacterium]